MLAADSPQLAFEMFELFRAAPACRQLVDGYLGEPGLISVAEDDAAQGDARRCRGAWHQDGAFMGEVRALNLWLSLSRCGDVAPGLDIVPRRLDELVPTQTDEAVLDDRGLAARWPRRRPATRAILRPIFEPGDALLFDELFLHQTGVGPVDAEPALRDRELVLRRLRRSRPTTRRSRRCVTAGPPYSHDPRAGVRRSRTRPSCCSPCLDAAGAALGRRGRRVRGRPHARARRLGSRRGASVSRDRPGAAGRRSSRSPRSTRSSSWSARPASRRCRRSRCPTRSSSTATTTTSRSARSCG